MILLMKKYVQNITKEDITSHIYQKSNMVATDFYRKFGSVIDDMATDIAVSFTILLDATDRDAESELSDADYQSAHLFWNALNTILSATELFIRGYSKEPAVLTRNALEVASTACELHIYPDKLVAFREGKLESTKSIGVVKNVIPAIGPMYGQLSNVYSHVSVMHSLPQGDYKNGKAMWIGGGFSADHEKFHLLAISNLIMTVDVVNDLLEFVFLTEIPDRRFWVDFEGAHHHKPIKRIKDRSENITKRLVSVFEKV